MVFKWAKTIRRKHKNDQNDPEDGDEVVYQDDPLILIKWDEAGLNARASLNPNHTKASLINCMLQISKFCFSRFSHFISFFKQ